VSVPEELDSIAEGIRSVHPLDAFELRFPHDRVARTLETLREAFEVAHHESGMGLRRGSEIGIDPEMNDAPTAREPTSPSGLQSGRLGLLVHAQDGRIERTRVRLVAFRHGQLNVVEDHP
jgi:hypothetical protein